jgi:ketosteroid isomerase-like protein
MRSRCLVIVALCPLALSAQDTTAAKASLLSADRAAAASAAMLAAALSPGASILLPDLAILSGAKSYAAYVEGIVTSSGSRVGWTPAHALVSRDGLFGCTTGVLHLVATDSTRPSSGRYAACWRRGGNGAWQMLALAHSSAPPQVRSLPDSIPGAPGSSGSTAPRGARAAREMTDADRAFARFSADSGGPGGAFARWIAADGMMLGARAVPVRGPEQARKAFASFPPSGRFAWAPVDSLARASRDGSLGFTIGEARIIATPSDTSYSKYLTIWRREGDGRYRFVFDIGSDRPAPRTTRR